MISKTPFGNTGHSSSRALLGAAAFGQVTQDEADAAIDLALNHGVNHFDTAFSYGESELRIGSWIQRHGRSFFLATKTGEREGTKAREQIHRSLERLQVAQVDLLQLHNLVEPEGWKVALGPGGALEAAIAARDEGLIRFIGVTGHGLAAPAQHRRALEVFPFDSVLCPLSYVLSQNEDYWADVQALLEVCRQRNVAVQTIKAIVRAPWGERPQSGPTWYEPLTDPREIELAVHWVLGHPGVFLNTAGDVKLLPRVLEAAEGFGSSPSAVELSAQVQRMGMKSLFTEPWL